MCIQGTRLVMCMHMLHGVCMGAVRGSDYHWMLFGGQEWHQLQPPLATSSSDKKRV